MTRVRRNLSITCTAMGTDDYTTMKGVIEGTFGRGCVAVTLKPLAYI